MSLDSVQDSVAMYYQKKKSLEGTVPLLWMEKLRPREGNHLPKSQGKLPAELNLGSVCLGALGEAQTCHLQRSPAQAVRVGGVEPHPGASHDNSRVPFKQKAACSSGWTRCPASGSCELPSHGHSLGRVKEGPSSVAPEGVGGQQGDNSRHAVWAQQGDPWRGR